MAYNLESKCSLNQRRFLHLSCNFLFFSFKDFISLVSLFSSFITQASIANCFDRSLMVFFRTVGIVAKSLTVLKRSQTSQPVWQATQFISRGVGPGAAFRRLGYGTTQLGRLSVESSENGNTCIYIFSVPEWQQQHCRNRRSCAQTITV